MAHGRPCVAFLKTAGRGGQVSGAFQSFPCGKRKFTWFTHGATAGTGGADVEGEDATDSICPKGWQFPTSNNSNSGSFQALTNTYSISSNAAGSTALVSAPLYFVRSGYVYSGSLRVAGYGGTYWSSTAHSSVSGAYSLRFYSGYVIPSFYFSRYYGQSVRCLAR